jgi:hypothetical protein
MDLLQRRQLGLRREQLGLPGELVVEQLETHKG